VTELRVRSGAAWKRFGRPDLIGLPDDGFVLGQTEPTWANSGSRIPIQNLTRNETINLITDHDGQVISGQYLPYGRIEVRHRNVTITDCIINIGWAPNGTDLAAGQRLHIQNNAAIVTNVNYDTSGLYAQYVTCDPINAGNNGTADDYDVSAFYFLSGATFYRCSARHVTDSFMPDIKPSTPAAPVQILGNYTENRFLATTPLATDGTHNDGTQLAGGDGHIIRGNAFHNPVGGVIGDGGKTVVGQNVVFTPYHGQISNVTIDANWLYGAYSQLSIWPRGHDGGPDCPGTTITNNRHNGQCVWPLIMTPESYASRTLISGNVAGPGGLKWNNGTLAPGAPINPYIVAAQF
jgi:hypothetical protein